MKAKPSERDLRKEKVVCNKRSADKGSDLLISLGEPSGRSPGSGMFVIRRQRTCSSGRVNSESEIEKQHRANKGPRTTRREKESGKTAKRTKKVEQTQDSIDSRKESRKKRKKRKK